MASPRRTTQSLPLRATPPHLRAAAHMRSSGRASEGPRPPSPRPPCGGRCARSVLLAGALVVAFGARWLMYGDALRVQDVQLVGVQVADPLAISEAARVTNRTLLTVDRGKVAAAVAAVPGVQSAVVRRDWPHTIVIEVTEHQGWGFWESRRGAPPDRWRGQPARVRPCGRAAACDLRRQPPTAEANARPGRRSARAAPPRRQLVHGAARDAHRLRLPA